MELHRKSREARIGYALAGVVVAVYVADLAVLRQTVGNNRVAVVLGGDVNLACLELLDGLIRAAVTVLELFGLCAVGECEQLVTEADTEHRNLALGELSELLDDSGVLCGISGAVREHNAVGIEREDFLGFGVSGNNRQVAAALVELSVRTTWYFAFSTGKFSISEIVVFSTASVMTKPLSSLRISSVTSGVY